MKSAKLNHVRALRQNMTDAEIHLWYFLRARRLNGYKFRRQHLIYPYVCDFICMEKKLIIECDGSQHARENNYDKKRNDFLTSKGYRVIRFWNDAVLRETSMVLDMIFEALEEPSFPQPLPPKKSIWRKG
jgi:very-short-patch-repair endonuclease